MSFMRRDTSRNTLHERIYLYDYDKVPAAPAVVTAEAKARGVRMREIEERAEERLLARHTSNGWDE